MAGEWLKMECCTPDKPETFAITSKMGWDDPDLTVGKLFRIWRWFDQQTVDGNAPGVTPTLLDRIAGATGFAQAMIDVGWLVVTEAGMSLPNFDKHNGATAKSRAQTAKRVANHRAKDEPNQGSKECNASNVTPPLAREEKRRKEITTKPQYSALDDLIEKGVDKQTAVDWLAVRKTKKLAPTKTSIDGVLRELGKAGFGADDGIRLCCERGWGGFNPKWLEGSPATGLNAWERH